MKKVCIVGVGLIGGSIGLALKKKKLAREVVGVARRKESAAKAAAFRAVDWSTLNLAEGVGDADLVILAAPISTILEQIHEIKPYLSKKALVIDVGSSKVEIEKAARGLRNFVGCHPMAGSEKLGVEYASADLFKDSVCFMTKPNSVIQKFWKNLGAIPVLVDAKKHDHCVARMSHLPHALAFSLFQAKKSYPKNLPLNPSIRELARLAKSDPELWADIFISNREAALEAIYEMEKKGIHPLKDILRKGRKKDLVRFIRNANQNSL